MSLKDKARKINFGALSATPPTPTPVSVAAVAATRPKTAPGLMMAHAADQRSELVQENELLKSKVAQLGEAAARASDLEEELKGWDGSIPAKSLDPKTITWSPWANRDQANFSGEAFLELKNEIASAGGNVQPIKVRPLKPGGEFSYEVVFGHRRHRACLELGLPVLALIENLGEVDLFVQMDRENRSRKNLSAWEQGMMYRRALDKGLFRSNRHLADAVGVDLSQIGKALSLARLPGEVIDAFASPLDLQFRWAKLLTDAHANDPAGVIARAKTAKTLGSARTASSVVNAILATPEQGGGTVLPPVVNIKRDGKTVATIKQSEKGKTMVSFEPGALTPEQSRSLRTLIEGFLKKPA
jgi:ParB family chromosome partitioning protein